MKNKILLIISIILFHAVLTGCDKNKLEIWSYTDEISKEDKFQKIIENYYQEAFPGIKIDYSFTSADQFQRRVDPVFETGRGAPDIFIMESNFVRKYAESGMLLDLTDIYENNRSKIFTYPAEIGSFKGRIYALSWQACPGAMFYRRSLAIKYLGTDNPDIIQYYFADFNRFLNTARIINNKSNGVCMVVPSLEDIQLPFFFARQDPWIINGKLAIDPIMEQYFYLVKEITENNWVGKIEKWSDGWFAGMNDELRNENGNKAEVFSYFLPTWGLQYILKKNASNTAGDWAMIQGPSAYFWGGSWIGAWKKTKNQSSALKMIEWLVTDEDFLSEYINDTGDFISNFTVTNKIKNDYADPFLSGQNIYEEFAIISEAVNSRLIQSTDAVIQDYFLKTVASFVNGEKSKDEALTDFKNRVKTELGID